MDTTTWGCSHAAEALLLQDSDSGQEVPVRSDERIDIFPIAPSNQHRHVPLHI
jgi:hypothetical protein